MLPASTASKASLTSADPGADGALSEKSFSSSLRLPVLSPQLANPSRLRGTACRSNHPSPVGWSASKRRRMHAGNDRQQDPSTRAIVQTSSIPLNDPHNRILTHTYIYIDIHYMTPLESYTHIYTYMYIHYMTPLRSLGYIARTFSALPARQARTWTRCRHLGAPPATYQKLTWGLCRV